MRILAIVTSLQEIAVRGLVLASQFSIPSSLSSVFSSDSVILSTSVSQSTTHHLLQTCQTFKSFITGNLLVYFPYICEKLQ